MDSISRFTERLAPVGAHDTVEKVHERFQMAPLMQALAVMTGGRTTALIEREAVERAMRAGLGDQAVGALTLGAPLIVDASADPVEVGRRLIAERGRYCDTFIVCDNGRYLGLGSLAVLFDNLCTDNQVQPRGLAGALQAISDAERNADSDAEHRRRFLEYIDHEFRAPLNGVMAMTELLQRQSMGADAQSNVRTIREAGESLLRILSDAVELSRGEQGLLELHPAPTQLRVLFDAVQTGWQPSASRPDHVPVLVSYNGDPELTAVIDAPRLKQVFDNLIGAALRFARTGSVEATLRTSQDADGVHIEGRVCDTGPGLPPEVLARIFEPGVIAADEGGMAIALARQIIHRFNGSIRAESNAGAGVTIIFDFIAPAVAVSDEAEADTGVRNAHVLVVDDNATNRMVAEALCEMFDCTSECACDGVEAVEAARSGRFDLILMDIKMPRMDGMAAARAIRALPGRAGAAPIIALTANVDPEDARAYIAAGMHSVVEKPIKPDRLLQAIQDALNEAGSRDQVAAA